MCGTRWLACCSHAPSLGAHGNVSDGREAPAAGSRRKPLRVPAPELHVHQPAVADVVVVGRGQSLDDAGLHPLPASALIPHAEGAQDAANRGLAGVPAAGVHRRVDGAVAVGLSLQVEHAAGLGGNDTLVAFHPTERSILSKAGDGAVDQSWSDLRQGVVAQAPVRHIPRAERLHQDVCIGGELDSLLAALRCTEVQHDASLAPIPGDPRRLNAERVSARRLDLDDLCPVVGQHQGAEGPGHPEREIQDGQACAWSCHGSPPGLAVWVPACEVSDSSPGAPLHFPQIGKIDAVPCFGFHSLSEPARVSMQSAEHARQQ